MSQNIQNFSQLTAIDTHNKIKVKVALKVFDGAHYELLINNQIVTDVFEADLLDQIDIIINKTTQGLVDIASITINDNEIMPLHLNYAEPATNRLTSEVTWHLSIKPNFYTWYHNALGQGFIA